MFFFVNISQYQVFFLLFQNDDNFIDPVLVPKTHKTWSIVNIILAVCSCQLLSLCFSLPALKRSCQAARHLDRGQLNAAEKNSRNALVFNLAASLLLMFGLFVSLTILFSVYISFYPNYLTNWIYMKFSTWLNNFLYIWPTISICQFNSFDQL